MSSLMPRRVLAYLRFSRDICPYCNVLDQAIAGPNGVLRGLYLPLEVVEMLSLLF
jgi:hypothetical protein